MPGYTTGAARLINNVPLLLPASRERHVNYSECNLPSVQLGNWVFFSCHGLSDECNESFTNLTIVNSFMPKIIPVAVNWKTRRGGT